MCVCDYKCISASKSKKWLNALEHASKRDERHWWRRDGTNVQRPLQPEICRIPKDPTWLTSTNRGSAKRKKEECLAPKGPSAEQFQVSFISLLSWYLMVSHDISCVCLNWLCPKRPSVRSHATSIARRVQSEVGWESNHLPRNDYDPLCNTQKCVMTMHPCRPHDCPLHWAKHIVHIRNHSLDANLSADSESFHCFTRSAHLHPLLRSPGKKSNHKHGLHGALVAAKKN